jgi:hypothetical protein
MLGALKIRVAQSFRGRTLPCGPWREKSSRGFVTSPFEAAELNGRRALIRDLDLGDYRAADSSLDGVASVERSADRLSKSCFPCSFEIPSLPALHLVAQQKVSPARICGSRSFGSNNIAHRYQTARS